MDQVLPLQLFPTCFIPNHLDGEAEETNKQTILICYFMALLCNKKGKEIRVCVCAHVYFREFPKLLPSLAAAAKRRKKVPALGYSYCPEKSGCPNPGGAHGQSELVGSTQPMEQHDL